MRTVVLSAPATPLEVVERPLPEADGGELLAVTACGVCHSDLHVVDGVYPSPMPLVLGHEVTGVHDELGPVMLYAPWGCRAETCRSCADELEMICPNSREAGLFTDGGYTEVMRVPNRRYLVPLGDLDPVTSAPLACGGLTAYRAVTRALEISRAGSRRSLVIGAGGLGQYAVQWLRHLSDSDITVADVSAAKRSRAIELGASQAFDPAEIDGDYDVVLDFVGATATLELASSRVARRGCVVVVGLFGGRVPFGLGAVPHEAVFTTSIWGSLGQLHELLALVSRVGVEHSVETLPLEQAQLAHDRLREGSIAGRIVLTTGQ